MPATYFHTKRRLLWQWGRLQGGKAPEKKGEEHPCIEIGEAKIPPGMKNEAGPHTSLQAHVQMLRNSVGSPQGACGEEDEKELSTPSGRN